MYNNKTNSSLDDLHDDDNEPIEYKRYNDHEHAKAKETKAAREAFIEDSQDSEMSQEEIRAIRRMMTGRGDNVEPGYGLPDEGDDDSQWDKYKID